MKHNLSTMGDRDAVFHRERKPRTTAAGKEVVCDKCKGVFARQWFYAHKKCDGDSIFESKAIPVNVCYASDKLGNDFKTNILSKFKKDQIGLLPEFRTHQIRRFPNISKNYIQKAQEGRRRYVMSDMRRLAGVFFQFWT